jgi:Lrp/AsnC family leucine-responsive transcriptional regulator
MSKKGRFMVNLDIRDRKILYQLDLNCRQSNSQIGRKVRLSKQVVDYRIKRMEEEGVISGYWTAINSFKLGYYCFRIYINFFDVTSQKKKEIIDYFIKQENIWSVIEVQGPIELDVVIWVDDIFTFNAWWDQTLKQYGNYFSKSTVSILTQVISCKLAILLDENKKNNIDNSFFITNCEGQPIKIDQIDYHILDELSLNGRIPLILLAEKIGTSSQTVKYRINNLKKKNLIQAFRLHIDYNKIGYKTQAIDFHLKDHSKKHIIIEYLKTNPHTYDIMSMNIGWNDIGIQALVKDTSDLMFIVHDIETKIPNAIRKTEFWISFTQYKTQWLPKMKFK